MSLYSRPYMRDREDGPHGGGLSVLARLMIVLVAVFVVQAVLVNVFRWPDFYPWLAATTDGLGRGRVWTLLTYALLHDAGNPLHLLLNLLGLWFVGRAASSIGGDRAMLGILATSTITGGLLWWLCNFGRFDVLVGISAGISGLFAWFCLRRPDAEVMLFPLPIALRARWLGLGYLALALFGLIVFELPGTSSIAHSAHLGGMAGGWLFLHAPAALARLPRPRLLIERPRWWWRRKAVADTTRVYSVDVRREPTDIRAEADRILDKINEKGVGSLTDEERRILEMARSAMSGRR